MEEIKKEFQILIKSIELKDYNGIYDSTDELIRLFKKWKSKFPEDKYAEINRNLNKIKQTPKMFIYVLTYNLDKIIRGYKELENYIDKQES